MAPFIYFAEKKERSFADVTVTDAGINTDEFLEAATGVVRMLKLPNSTALAFVITDIEGNITKVTGRYLSAPEKSTTLEELVKNEMAEGKKEGRQALLWLNRGLAFTKSALRRMQAESELKMPEAFKKAYDGTLATYHGWIVKKTVNLALGMCPAKDDLYIKLKEDTSGGPAATQEDLDEKLNKWLDALDQISTRIDTFYEVNNYKKDL